MQYDTVYHGTSVINLAAILKQGIQPVAGGQRVWWDSYPKRIYAWSDRLCEEAGVINLRSLAEESGMAACSARGGNRIVVFEARVPVRLVEPDSSGPGMYESGAGEVYGGIHKRYLRRYWISEDISALIPFVPVATNMNYRDSSQLRDWVAKQLEGLHVWWGDAPVSWEEHSISQVKRSTHGTVAHAL